MRGNILFGWHVIFIFSFLACNSKPKEILVDNPTEKSISIKFDQSEKIIILPGEMKTISLIFGKEKLVVNDDKEYEIILDSNKEYLLNPGLETYYIENIIYGSEKGIKQYYKNYGVKKFQIDSFIIEGEYEEIKSKLLIEKNWTFSFNETPFNKVKQVSSDEYFKVRKLHRGADMRKQILESMIKQAKEALKK